MINLKLKNKISIEWLYSIIVASLILLGTYNNVFSILAFVLIAYIVLIHKPDLALRQMIFILPLANIFKMEPGSQSFFTYVLLLYVINFVFRLKKINIILLLFVIYMTSMEILTDTISIPRTIKFVSGLLMLHYVISKVDLESNHKALFKRYILGVIIASSIAYLNFSFFNVSRYLSIQELGIRYGYGDMTRFTGLDTDPNYYAVSIIVSLCLIVLLYYRQEINVVSAVIQAAFLVFFALLTYSKSVFLMMSFPIAFLVIANHRKKRYVLQIILIIIGVATMIYAAAGKIQAVNIILTRILVNTNLNGITTGRIDLWISYCQYLGDNIIKAIFGVGLGADYAPNVNRAVHNAYIEAIYHLGVIGFVWLAVVLRSSYAKYGKSLKKNILNYSVLVCVLTMYLFLNELFYYDAPFHFLLAFVVMNTNYNLTSKEIVLKEDSLI